MATPHFLALEGYQCTVFEALSAAGGMLRVGIPDYRLPPDILERDINAIRALGVDFKTNTAIGQHVSADELKQDFDAIFIASGAHESRKLEIPGEDCKDVVHGVNFLRKWELQEKTDTR